MIKLMASGNLYNETLRSAMREPRPEPRESKAWLAWLLLGMMAGGSIMGTWDMYQERYRGAAMPQSCAPNHHGRPHK